MILRHQLPVYSPLTLRSILAGWKALVQRDSQATEVVQGLVSGKYGTRDVLLTDSGTSALTLAIRELCRPVAKRLVALPAYGCYDIATAADGADVDVLLYDVDAQTLGPDLESLARALEQQPAAVVIAHLYGIPVDLDAVLALCRRYDVAVIEDAAQGFGARYSNRPLGSFGAFAVLSFGRGKGITGGGGGALLVAHDRYSEAFKKTTGRIGSSRRGLKELVGATAQLILGSPRTYGLPASLPFLHLGETVYRDPAPPSRMATSVASVLSSSWALAAGEGTCRRRNAALISEFVERSEIADNIRVPETAGPSYLRFPILVSGGNEDRFSGPSAIRLGVMPGYPKSLSDLSGFFDRCCNRDADLPGARTLASRLFTVPTHSRVSTRDLIGLEALICDTSASEQ